MGKRSPQEVAERVGKRIREDNNQRGGNMSQTEAKAMASRLLNQNHRQKKG